MDATLGRISGKGTLAGAIRYATTRWAALTLYAGMIVVVAVGQRRRREADR